MDKEKRLSEILDLVQSKQMPKMIAKRDILILFNVGGNEVAVCGCNSWNRNLNAFTGKCLTCGKKV